MSAAWGWLVANGLWHDLVGWAVFTVCTGTLAWWKARPWVREHLERQRRIADLLDTDTPGGLADVHAALRNLEHAIVPPDQHGKRDH